MKDYGRKQYGNSYGRRGYDSKYRGYDELDKMYNEYGRYSESRERYGGRGIKMCDDWINNPSNFYNWAINNGYKEGLTIDRIDVNGNYEPNNCRWVTKEIQDNNRRTNRKITYKGKTKNLTQWCKEYKINIVTLSDRLKRGWSLEEALTIPTKGKHQKVFK